LVDHIVIDGGPEHAETWTALEQVLAKTWQHANGAALKIARLAIDSGYESSAVYTWGRRMGVGQVSPIKGVEGFNRSSPVSGPTFVDATEGGKKVRRGARLWTVAVSTFKSETYRYLRLERPTDEELAEGIRYPAGTVHLPSWADSEWCKQFVAEQLVTVKTRRGFTKLEWQKLRERNEALDCRVYARAAVWIVGADRWSEAKWRDLEAQIGPSETVQPEETQAGQIRRTVRRPRRIIKFSGMH
jgi:phage terminase large subunit GpA-like protein